MKKPNSISTAITLLWASLVVTLYYTSFVFDYKYEIFTFLMAIGFEIGYFYFFIYNINKGRNWARIVLLIIFLINTPLELMKKQPTELFKINIIIDLLLLVALIFLFKKTSSDWFKSMSKGGIKRLKKPR